MPLVAKKCFFSKRLPHTALTTNWTACETELFCIFNADGSFDQKDLDQMRTLCKQHQFIFASRYLKNAGSDDDTLVTYVGNKIFSLISNQNGAL